jgi:hypothetical protein
VRAEPNGGAPDLLLNKVRTRIYFSLGAPSAGNLAENREISERLRTEIQQVGDFDLYVTMTCNVCVDTSSQRASVRFLHALGASTRVAFEIIPDIERVSRDVTPVITFSIDGGGIEFDFLRLFVRIGPQGSTTSTSGTSSILSCVPNLSDPNERKSDLVITLGRADDRLTMSFVAFNPLLDALLRKVGAGTPAAPTVFNTGVQSLATIAKTAGDTYVRLEQLVTDHPELRNALPEVGILSPRAQIAFDDKAKSTAIKALYDLGLDLYDTLFYLTADVRLRDILKTIEEFGDQHPNLRILIYSRSTYLPWQLLHRPEPDEANPAAEQFWGFKYIIGVIPTDPDRDCGRLPGILTVEDDRSALYVHYWPDIPPQGARGTANDDMVSKLGAMFGEVLSKQFGRILMAVRTKRDFLDVMKESHDNLRLVWSFTHGHSGSVFSLIDGHRVALQRIEGQRLDLSESQFVSARDLKLATVPATKRFYFEQRPFVFLNGCETGTQGIEGTSDQSLPGIFIARGARGVIATEASIWDLFGYNFSGVFLEKISASATAGEAILETRREFLIEGNNPLGLLYTFYGNPAVRLELRPSRS